MESRPVSFFVGAHQDDWQIFAGNLAHQDIRAGARVVLIYLTAGDEGRQDGWWQARESAAIASCTFATNARASEEVIRTFGDRKIASRAVGNTKSYFLRLPDGNYPGWGEGYES